MYILKEIPEEGTYGENVKLRLTKAEFETIMEANSILWESEMFEWAKNSKGKYTAYKQSIQNPDAYARFNYDGQTGGIRLELPRKYEGEFFSLLDKLTKEIEGFILDYQYRPINQSIIDEFKGQEYKNLNLTRYIERTFGDNSIWLCIKTEESDNLLKHLNLEIKEQDTFVNALERSWGDSEIMITNPINGWTVIHGNDLIYTQYSNKKDYLETENHYNRTKEFINTLSKQFGKVGFFMDSEKSSASGAWVSINGKLSFGYVQDELEKKEFGDCTEINSLFKNDPQTLSGIYCIDPYDFIYSEESTKLVGIAQQECYFSIFDHIKK